MSSFLGWLLSILQRLRAKFSRNVHGILKFFTWLLRQSRCSRGMLKTAKGRSGAQDPTIPKDTPSPSPERIVLTKPEPDVFMAASAVPRSAYAGSVPNLAAIPESPTPARPSTWFTRPSSVAVPNHESLSPYPTHAPFHTRSYQDIPLHSRPTHEANTEDSASTSSHRQSVASHIGSINVVTGSATRVSSRAPSRYFGGGLSQASRSPSRNRSRAPSPVQTNGLSTATPISTPPVRPGTLGTRSSSSVNLSVVSPSESSLALNNESLAFSSLHPGSVPHSPRSSRVELGANGANGAVEPSNESVTVDDGSQASIPLPEGRRLNHLTPERTQRYDRIFIVPQFQDVETVFPALQTSWPHCKEDEHGSWIPASSGDWTPVLHPEGNLYFYHPTKHIYTDMYLYNDSIRAETELFASYLDELLLALRKPLPTKNWELVLEVRDAEDGTKDWFYYYIDHEQRCVFWLQTYAEPDFVDDNKVKHNPSHLKMLLESLYWVHWAYFPKGNRDFPVEVSDDLQGLLITCGVDVITSTASTCPYTVADVKTFTSFIKKAQSLPDPKHNPYLAWTIARLMSFMVYWRWCHFHGQRGARLDREQSVHRMEPRPRTLLISIFSPVFFFAPEVHLTEVEKIWTDEVLNNTTWKPFIDKLLAEWQEFVLFGTVLLNANVAFLEIPYVGETAQAGVSQILSYLSIIASVGTIVLGLLLIRQNRAKASREVPAEAANHLIAMKSKRYGLEPLAILYSLPYALLMWSMLLFVVAFLTLCFNGSDLTTRLLVGPVFLAIIVLITWCLLSGISIAADTWFAGSLRLWSKWKELTKNKRVMLQQRWADRDGDRSFLWEEVKRCFHFRGGGEEEVAMGNGVGMRSSDTASYLSTHTHTHTHTNGNAIV